MNLVNKLAYDNGVSVTNKNCYLSNDVVVRIRIIQVKMRERMLIIMG